jgi:hypothetical protein
MGNLKSQEKQICGKTIEVQIATEGKNHPGKRLLGLKNNKTGKLDLFLSTIKTTDPQAYQHYDPVIYDALSGTFIPAAQDRPGISWGNSPNALHLAQYRLVLGSHVYNCSIPVQWPSELANELYGHQD